MLKRIISLVLLAGSGAISLHSDCLPTQGSDTWMVCLKSAKSKDVLTNDGRVVTLWECEYTREECFKERKGDTKIDEIVEQV